MKSQLPKRYELSYLIYHLCDGDLSKREEIASKYTYSEAKMWLLLGGYRQFVEKKYLEKR